MIGSDAIWLRRVFPFGLENSPGINPRRWISCSLFLMLSLLMGSVSAQDAKPLPSSASARLVRVRIGDTYGLGGDNLTKVEPFFMITESEGVAANGKFFHRKVKSAITKREWGNLQQVVDAKALASSPQAVCNAIVDQPCSWVELELSDKAKIHIFYDWPNPPASVVAVLRQVDAIRVQVNLRELKLHGFAVVTPAQEAPNPPSTDAVIPDAAAAKKRAEGILGPKKWLFAPLKAELKDGKWTVMGTMYCQEALPQKEHYCYGGAGVRLRKSDGAILEIFPPTHN